MITRRALLAAPFALGLACRPTTRGAWPTQPVRIVVPFGPGSSADLAARLFAARLSVVWETPVVVDNRGGGDGMRGVHAFVQSRDGHTLLFSPLGIVTANPLLHDHLPFDPARDLVPIAGVGRPSIGLAAFRSLEAATLRELVALARRRPHTLAWTATAGLPELVFRAFLAAEGLEVTHVPYSDVAAAVRDLDAGRIHIVVAALPTLAPALETTHARLLAVTGSTRATSAPDVPTTTEAGYPALTVDGPFGFFGWRDMPEPLRRRVAADVADATRDAAIVSRLARVGFQVAASTPEEFTGAVEAQRAQVVRLARLAGLAPSVGAGR